MTVGPTKWSTTWRASTPWAPRGIEVRGRAEAHRSAGAEVAERLGAGFPFDEVYLRIHPRRIASWGIDSDVMSPNVRDVA